MEELIRQKQFHTTRWSLILKAQDDLSNQNARKAMEELFKIYWYPLYVFVRRKGFVPEHAEDLTQSFFVDLMEQKKLSAPDKVRGKFRSFLLASIKNFICDEERKSRALKRGGKKIVSLDAQSAEQRYFLEPKDKMTPEKLYERKWALSLLDQVMKQINNEYHSAGQEDLFAKIKFKITGDSKKESYLEIAQQLNTTEGAIKVAVHRLRKRYKELLRLEISHTVSSPEEVKEELRHLLNSLS